MLPPISFLTQSAHFIQSNDVIYRAVLDPLGFDVPMYAMGRNKNEKREILLHILITGTVGFVLAPLNAFILNKLIGRKGLKGNHSYFLLNWQHLDPHKEGEAVQHLEKCLERYNERIKNPVAVDKFTIMRNRINNTIKNTEKAIAEIKMNPDMLKKAYKAKRSVLLIDILYTIVVSKFIHTF